MLDEINTAGAAAGGEAALAGTALPVAHETAQVASGAAVEVAASPATDGYVAGAGFTPENIEALRRKREAGAAAGTAPAEGAQVPGQAQAQTQTPAPASAAERPLYAEFGCADEAEFRTRLGTTLEQQRAAIAHAQQVTEYALGLEARLQALESGGQAKGNAAGTAVVQQPPAQDFRYWSQALGMPVEEWNRVAEQEPYRASEMMTAHFVEKNPKIQALIKKHVESIVGPLQEKLGTWEKGWDGQRAQSQAQVFEQGVTSHATAVLDHYATKLPGLKAGPMREKVVEAIVGNWDEIIRSAQHTQPGNPVRALDLTIRAALAELNAGVGQAQAAAANTRTQRITRQLSGGVTGVANSGAASARDGKGRFVGGLAEAGKDPKLGGQAYDIMVKSDGPLPKGAGS